jgi:hypothetical protein
MFYILPKRFRIEVELIQIIHCPLCGTDKSVDIDAYIAILNGVVSSSENHCAVLKRTADKTVSVHKDLSIILERLILYRSQGASVGIGHGCK